MFHEQNTNTTNDVTNKSPTSVCKLGELTVYNKVNNDGIVTVDYQVRYKKNCSNREDITKNKHSLFENDGNIFASFANAIGKVDILDWRHINDRSKEVTIPFYSEYKCNDHLFRSHPNY